VLLAALAAMGAGTTGAGAQIAFTPCKSSNDFACASLNVPLDPSGATPGTLTLALRRHRAPVGEASTAIIALAGGPGQAALPFTEQFSEVLGPVADTRDLIVFDQRGVGRSHPLSCHVFERGAEGNGSLASAVATCAGQIGANRAFFTTADTVADIEAIRKAGGYEKLILYGTSYGTKVAEQYAQAHPDRVQALVLDSVVPPAGPDALNRSTFQAIPRVLAQECAAHLCAHVTSHPLADLTRVLARIRRAPLRPRALFAHGAAHKVPITAGGIFQLLLGGDFSDLLRSQLLTSLASAADGDPAPIARLLATVERATEGEEEGIDLPLYFSTVCEEEQFPWNRATTSPSARLAEALTATRASGGAQFTPFTASEALAFGDAEACSSWPFATPAAPVEPSTLPDVPTLILSGADDLRTPTSNAQQVAAAIPGAKLLVVPDTGHSVLSGESGSCASDALKAFFAAKPIVACKPTPLSLALRPEPLPPPKLADVGPVHGYRGRAGRTLQALRLTLGDFGIQLALHLQATGPAESIDALEVGGLRSGWAHLHSDSLTFHSYSFVPGMIISGTLKGETADLVVSGSTAAHGTLRNGSHGSLVGSLDGHSVRLSSASLASAAIVGADGAASENLRRRGADSSARLPRGLARLLGWLLQF
jgi:pimeloyl-ACP methyl ester carboxylesterase